MADAYIVLLQPVVCYVTARIGPPHLVTKVIVMFAFKSILRTEEAGDAVYKVWILNLGV